MIIQSVHSYTRTKIYNNPEFNRDPRTQQIRKGKDKRYKYQWYIKSHPTVKALVPETVEDPR